MFAFFRTVFGFLLGKRKLLKFLIPLAQDAIRERVAEELPNAEKKNQVYRIIREAGKSELGEDISEHIVDIAFGTAFGQLRDKGEV